MTNWSAGWIKVYHEVIIDDKMGLLPDHLWRRAIECMIAAGAEGRGGYLPDLRVLARKLVTTETDLEQDLAALAVPGIKIVEQRPDGWYVTNHLKRQTPTDATSAQRQAAFRERQKAKHDALQAPLRNALPEALPVTLYNGEEERKRRREEEKKTRREDEETAPAAEFAPQFAAFANQIHMIASPIQADEMTDRLKELQAHGVLEWWDAALKVAADNNARRWAYVRATLDGCLREGHAPGTPRTNGRNNGRSATAQGVGLQSIAGSAADERWRAANADPAAVAEAAATTF